MQPYPTYQNYIPYQQPLDQLGQLRMQQQFQQPMMVGAQMPLSNQQFQQPSGISGKFVQSVDGITANDVPMDGSTAIFPKQDMAEIYAKSWNADGTIKTVIYRPVTEQSNNSASVPENTKFDLSDASTEAFMERFDDVVERISRLEKTMNRSGGFQRKKEAANE